MKESLKTRELTKKEVLLKTEYLWKILKINLIFFFLSCSEKKDNFFVVEKSGNKVVSLEMNRSSANNLKAELASLMEVQYGDIYLIEGNGVDEVSKSQKTDHTLVGIDGNENVFLSYNFRKDAPFKIKYKIYRSDTVIKNWFIFSKVEAVSGEHEYEISLIPYLTSRDRDFLSRTIWPESYEKNSNSIEK